jgi:MoxR-like ATPase
MAETRSKAPEPWLDPHAEGILAIAFPEARVVDLSLRAECELDQALALTEERSYCLPDDIKRLVIPVFAHRIAVSSRYSSAMRRSEEAEAVLREIMKTISVPL